MKHLFFLAAALSIADLAYGEDKKFEIQSGEIEYQITAVIDNNEIRGKNTTYFDDYGRKMANRIVSNKQIFSGEDKPTDITNIILPYKTYLLNNIDKTYIVISEGNDDYDVEYQEDEGYKNIGKGIILGRECDILYYEEIDEDEMNTEKIWIWKGLTLKIESTFQHGNYKSINRSEAQRLEIKPIASSHFEVPGEYQENVKGGREPED